MTEKPTDPTPDMGSAADVARIRDIIFGSQMRDYESMFQTAQRDLERLQQELDQLNERLADQDTGHTGKLQELRREMRKADDRLRDEMRETAQQLSNDKVDRATLGDMLIELGTRLKTGGTVADLLSSIGELEQD